MGPIDIRSTAIHPPGRSLRTSGREFTDRKAPMVFSYRRRPSPPPGGLQPAASAAQQSVESKHSAKLETMRWETRQILIVGHVSGDR
jgi:hypothetical protein